MIRFLCFLASFTAVCRGRDELQILTPEIYKAAEGMMNSDDLIAVFAYRSASELDEQLVTDVEDQLVQVVKELHEVDVPISFYKHDCGQEEIDDLCSRRKDIRAVDALGDDIEIADNSYHFMANINANKTLHVNQPFGVDGVDLITSEVKRLVFGLFINLWKNWQLLHDVQVFEKDVMANDNEKFVFLCYGDRDQTIGRPFCQTLGYKHRNDDDIMLISVENLETLNEIAVFNDLTIPGMKEILPMFGFWYLNCPAKKPLKDCTIHQYFGRDDFGDVDMFMQCAKYPNCPKQQKNCLTAEYSGDKMLAEPIIRRFRGTIWQTMNSLPDGAPPGLSLRFPGDKDSTLFKTDGTQESVIRAIEVHLKRFYDLGSLYEESTAEDPTVVEPTDPRVQDDEVELVLHALRDPACFHCPPKYEMVRQLNDTSTPKFIAENDATAILFWLNVDTVSRAVFHVWVQASKLLSDDRASSPVGAVACHDWPDVCDAHSVITWPRLLAFRRGRPTAVTQYQSVWDSRMLADWFRLVEQPSIRQLSTRENVDAFVEGTFDYGMTDNRKPFAVSVLFAESKDSIEVETFKKVAKKLHGRYVLGMVTGQLAKDWVKANDEFRPLPFLKTFKPKDKFEPFVNGKGNYREVDAVLDFIETSTKPRVAKINELSMPALYKSRVPFLILFAPDVTETKSYENLGAVAIEPKFLDAVVCGTMPVDKTKKAPTTVMKAYNLTAAATPAFAFVDFKGNVFTQLNAESLSRKQLAQWIDAVISGSIDPSVMLPKKDFSKRPLMYDQLGLIYGTPSVRPSEAEAMERAEKMKGQTARTQMKAESDSGGHDEL